MAPWDSDCAFYAGVHCPGRTRSVIELH